ncbi:hypothetical protein J4468_01300 [Candidatus Woesearchaeota archaeon]|nr:hypothetical protein [Candidatus Woesearchaeota archaeon]
MKASQETFEIVRLFLDKYIVENKRSLEGRLDNTEDMNRLCISARNVQILLGEIARYYGLEYKGPFVDVKTKAEEDQLMMDKLKEMY